MDFDVEATRHAALDSRAQFVDGISTSNSSTCTYGKRSHPEKQTRSTGDAEMKTWRQLFKNPNALLQSYSHFLSIPRGGIEPKLKWEQMDICEQQKARALCRVADPGQLCKAWRERLYVKVTQSIQAKLRGRFPAMLVVVVTEIFSRYWSPKKMWGWVTALFWATIVCYWYHASVSRRNKGNQFLQSVTIGWTPKKRE